MVTIQLQPFLPYKVWYIIKSGKEDCRLGIFYIWNKSTLIWTFPPYIVSFYFWLWIQAKLGLLYLMVGPPPPLLSSVIKVSSFGKLPIPLSDDVIYVQPLKNCDLFPPPLLTECFYIFLLNFCLFYLVYSKLPSSQAYNSYILHMCCQSSSPTFTLHTWYLGPFYSLQDWVISHTKYFCPQFFKASIFWTWIYCV